MSDTGMTCYCDAPDHDMCWDGTLNNYAPNCSCCRDTQRECAEKTRASLEEAVKKKLVSEGVSEDWLDNHLKFL